MLEHQQKRQEVDTNSSEQIEFLHELVEGLKLQLHDQQQEQQELEQELIHTNSELCEALMLDRVCLEEAKAIAETILQSKKSLGESLSELLSAIYGSPVKLAEVEIDKSIITKPLRSTDTNNIINNSRELRKHTKQMRSQFKELGFQFVSLKATYVRFRISSAKFIDELQPKKGKTDVIIDAKESDFTPPPENNSIEVKN